MTTPTMASYDYSSPRVVSVTRVITSGYDGQAVAEQCLLTIAADELDALAALAVFADSIGVSIPEANEFGFYEVTDGDGEILAAYRDVEQALRAALTAAGYTVALALAAVPT